MKIEISNLVPIARALHTTVDYLMGWDNTKETPTTESSSRCENEAMHLFDNLSETRKFANSTNIVAKNFTYVGKDIK